MSFNFLILFFFIFLNNKSFNAKEKKFHISIRAFQKKMWVRINSHENLLQLVINIIY